MSEHDSTWNDEHVDGSKRGRGSGDDPGAFIGHEPERSTETIPGGLGRADERVSAVDSQPGPQAGPSTGWAPPPEGHREAEKANDDRIREAGDRT